jgi:hypothetical protein
MKATRTTTFYRKNATGYTVLREERHEYELDELPQDHWHTETMHVAWDWSNTLGPLTDQGGFYDVGNMTDDEIRRAGHE